MTRPWAEQIVARRYPMIAALSIAAIVAYLILHFGTGVSEEVANWPLFVALALGGVPIVTELLFKILKRDFGSDLLAGISIVASILLGQYLAGTLVVLMLSGGEAIEGYAVRSAASVLHALARRMPLVAHRRRNSHMEDVPLEQIAVDDALVVFPHEICPVDGEVLGRAQRDGRIVFDRRALSHVEDAWGHGAVGFYQWRSGAGDPRHAAGSGFALRADHARDAGIGAAAAAHSPIGRSARRLYTPLAVAIAIAAWIATGQALRFLAVLVVATPCPLLIAIPVAIIGSISLSARRGIIVRDPAVLEQVDTCRTVIFDKTGTLTYGEPRLEEQLVAPGFEAHDVLMLAASLERYSKHPLSEAILLAAQQERLAPCEAAEIRERPGEGLRGTVAGRKVQITSRKKLGDLQPELAAQLPPLAGGLECVIVVDDRYAATYRFRDQPRHEGSSFVGHLAPKHHFDRVLLVSGDRESEVRYLADQVGIKEVYAEQSPEDKVNIVRRETQRAKTLFLGDGINDAPALLAATVGLAFGTGNEITGDASGAVVMDTSLERVDEFMHISRRMRVIALQSAVGGMAASMLGMLFAAWGYLPPVAGAILQELIDIVVVMNALRTAWPPRSLSDF